MANYLLFFTGWKEFGIIMDEQKVGAKTKIAGFLHDVNNEFRKISWPTRKELVGSTWLVGIVILLLGGFVFICDQVLLQLLDWVTRR